MKILIIYGTSEGQTRRVAERMARRIRAAGSRVVVSDAADHVDFDPARFDRTIVAASLHMGEYQDDIRSFAAAHREALILHQAAFVSVSLSAAGRELDDVRGLADCVAQFERETGWRPARLLHVAGAFRFSRYGWVKRQMMRFIAWRRGQSADGSRDYELTDWSAVDRFVDELLRESTVHGAGGARE